MRAPRLIVAAVLGTAVAFAVGCGDATGPREVTLADFAGRVDWNPLVAGSPK